MSLRRPINPRNVGELKGGFSNTDPESLKNGLRTLDAVAA